MYKIPLSALFSIFFIVYSSQPVWADYSKHSEALTFIEHMVKEHNFSANEVKALLRQAEKKQAILDAISRPAEKTKEWFEYREIFVQEMRINQGVKFWQANADDIARAAKTFNMAPEMIVAIIGIETLYGRNKGGYRVIDALSTLGFDYPERGEFFRSQLEAFMLMVREQKQDPLKLVGSYAGAMGYGQFIPSSYRNFAVDFDNDGKIDIWDNVTDAIGSVANYFSAHHWQQDGPILVRAHIEDDHDASLLNVKTDPSMSLAELALKGFTPVVQINDQTQKAVPIMVIGDQGKEFWLGFNNFYVITRYNRSHLYAMAAWELSQKVKQSFMQQTDMQRAETPNEKSTLK